jgi:glycine cleavage system H protein
MEKREVIVSVPEELRYSEEHEWVSGLGGEDGIVTIGITAHAADALGEIVYLELQQSEGDAVEAGEPCGEVESTKSVSDIYSPVSGEITAINSAVVDEPKVINDDPYGEGWIFKVRISEEPGDLLDSAAYDKLIEES